jgi:hypothetical protein
LITSPRVFRSITAVLDHELGEVINDRLRRAAEGR